MDSGSDAMEGSDFDGSYSDFDEDENVYFSSGEEEKEDEDDEKRMDSEGTFFFYISCRRMSEISKGNLHDDRTYRIA